MTRRQLQRNKVLWRRVVSPDPWRRVRLGLLMLVIVLLVGTAGYTLLGLTVFDGVIALVYLYGVLRLSGWTLPRLLAPWR